MRSTPDHPLRVGSFAEPKIDSVAGRPIEAVDSAKVQRMSRAIVGVYLGACFLAFNDSLRLMVVLIGGVAVLARAGLRQSRASASADIFSRLATHFLGWMTVRSLLEYGMANPTYSFEAGYWMFGTFLLLLFGWLVWQAARNPDALEALGSWVGLSAMFAATVSLVLFYSVLPHHVLGERLCNWFVYGGWNSVSSGLTFGFAAMWLIASFGKGQSRSHRALHVLAIVILIAAVLFTRSRGALLALAAGHVALTCARGFRRTLVPWVTFAGMLALFIASGPLINRLAIRQVEARVRSAENASIEQRVGQRLLTPTPVREMIARGDSGRLTIYRDAARTLTQPHQWIFGVGQWGPAEFASRRFGQQLHLHSAFFSTLVHGGAIGLGLLIATLAVGFRRARQLATEGRDLWFILICYGCAGLIFDGHTLTTLTSLPQVECLLIAFPLVAAAAIGAKKSATP